MATPIVTAERSADTVRLTPARKLTGVYRPPPDKSMAHRALILATIATGKSTVSSISRSTDVAATVSCLRQLGVSIEEREGSWSVESPGWNGWTPPERALDCANSGTTMRLLAGCLAGQSFAATLIGDDSLSRRPMERVAEPLRRMGARIMLSAKGTAPIEIAGAQLRGITYESPVASAQVKSAILLAGLTATGETTVIESIPTRDHTERMLTACAVDCVVETPSRPTGDWRERRLEAGGDDGDDASHRRTIRLGPERSVQPHAWNIPGDFSAGAFVIAAAVGVRKSDVIIENIGLNPTRTGFLRVLRRMGAEFDVTRQSHADGEPRGRIRVGHGTRLKAVRIAAEEVPSLIDELPMIAVLAGRAEGVTVIRGAGELRHKESNRIAAVSANLRAMNAKVAELEDGWAIEGPTEWRAATIDPAGDHRIAMAFAVAALWADGPSTIQNAQVAAVSDPDFFSNLIALAH